MSENDFYQIQGDSYRGSRYGNFSGGGTDPQGNVSSAITENSANQVGKNTDAAPTPTSVSKGLTGSAELPRTSDLVIGAALPYAGGTVGQVAGSVIGAGGTFGQGISEGVSGLANNVSGGLIGTAANPTNLAIANSGGAFGPATPAAVNATSASSNVGNFGSGANLGGAAGAGLFSAAATLLQGGSIGDAAKTGIGTAVGTAIGNAILPGIGGFVGGFLGSTVFCFTPETPILMADGTQKKIGEIRIGDIVVGGGTTTGIGEAFAEKLYRYKNVLVAEGHAVFQDGEWMRVEESVLAEPVETTEQPIVCPIATENRIVLTPWFIAADIFEIDPDPDRGYSEAERIDVLNSDPIRLEALTALEKEACTGGP